METGKVIEAAIAYFENDIRRISHLLKVYGFAKAIGEKEQLDLFTMECLETAAVLHDIGIKISEEKYQSSAGTGGTTGGCCNFKETGISGAGDRAGGISDWTPSHL